MLNWTCSSNQHLLLLNQTKQNYVSFFLHTQKIKLKKNWKHMHWIEIRCKPISNGNDFNKTQKKKFTIKWQKMKQNTEKWLQMARANLYLSSLLQCKKPNLVHWLMVMLIETVRQVYVYVWTSVKARRNEKKKGYIKKATINKATKSKRRSS